MAYLLGIDTGGTYTDAVMLNESYELVASAKALTTKGNLIVGVNAAADKILADKADAVTMVSLSTTLATNAIVEGQGSPICLLLLGCPEQSLDRAGLGQALGSDPAVFIGGGHRASGEEQAPLDTAAVERAIDAHASKVEAFAVAGYFAVRNPAHELTVRELVQSRTGLPVACGHQLSANLDVPRRALTAALNARLIPVLARLIHAVEELMRTKGINAPLMVVKGDGSLVTAEVALEAPVETILSGPAASLIGARHLCGEDDIIVADMGGTTTDIALLQNGTPALNCDGALVGGWRTMVEAVQVHTFGLGGDSEIHIDHRKGLHIGPKRIVPLSLLAADVPAVVDVLAEQCRRSTRDYFGKFAFRLRPPEHQTNLPLNQRRLLEALSERPIALADLLPDHTYERPLYKLVQRGLVAMGGFTPTDAAHVCGNQQQWCVDAARLGSKIFRDQAENMSAGAWRDEMEFCEYVLHQVSMESARSLITTALAEQKHEIVRELPQPQRELVDHALGQVEGWNLLEVNIGLKKPVAAIGAPVATYYPAVAKQLGTRLCLTPHAAVANAVGAVVGAVVEKAHAMITPIDDDRFRVHCASGVETFVELELAAAFALDETTRLAREQAKRSGASCIQVNTARHDNIVDDPGGGRLFIESKITATATGRPPTTGHIEHLGQRSRAADSNLVS